MSTSADFCRLSIYYCPLQPTSSQLLPTLVYFLPNSADFRLPVPTESFLMLYIDTSWCYMHSNMKRRVNAKRLPPLRGKTSQRSPEEKRLPPRGAHGVPGGPGNPSQNNGQPNQEISFHGAICIVALCRGAYDSNVRQFPPDGRGFYWGQQHGKKNRRSVAEWCGAAAKHRQRASPASKSGVENLWAQQPILRKELKTTETFARNPSARGGPTMSGQPSFEAKGLSAPEYVLALHELADNVPVLLHK
jgi:hypothetical protein